MRLLFCLLLLIAQPVASAADQVLYCVDELATGFAKKNGEYKKVSFELSKRTLKVTGDIIKEKVEGFTVSYYCEDSFFTRINSETMFCESLSAKPSIYYLNKDTLKYIHIIHGRFDLLKDGDDAYGTILGRCEKF
ncbi:MAG: hypothetical protein ACON5C_09375 [Alphaproteobacteria bacterium]